MIDILIAVSIITVSLIGVYVAIAIGNFIRLERQHRKLQNSLSNLKVYTLGEYDDTKPNTNVH